MIGQADLDGSIELEGNGRIEVAGCIGSGKTTLARWLTGAGLRVILEDHRVNPFWEAFYADPAAHAFETEISFLLQHYHFAKVVHKRGRSVLLDHSFELDMAFAQLGLTGTRMEVFRSVYREVVTELGPPRVLVYVECGSEELQRRIRARGRKWEENLPLDFVRRLANELERRIELAATSVPVVTISAETNDFREWGTWGDDALHSISRAWSGEVGR